MAAGDCAGDDSQRRLRGHFYAFSVLLGEDAAAREFSRTVLSASLGMGVVVSGALALLVGTLCDLTGPFRGVASVGEVRPTSLLRRSEKCATVIRVRNSGTRYNVLYLSRKGNTL